MQHTTVFQLNNALWVLEDFKEVFKEQPDKNIVISPLSVNVLLALLTLGAESHTHEELLGALHLPSDDFIRSSFKGLSEQLKGVKRVTLNIANRIFVNEGAKLNPNFKQDSIDVFNAGLEAVDFNNPENAAKVLNSWVESKTNNRIKEMMNSGAFDSTNQLVLVNAIYFKGNWKEKFDKDLTANRYFHCSTGAKVLTPTMSISFEFPYVDDPRLDAKFLQIPYEGEQMSMVFALPGLGTNLPDLQAKLAAQYDILDIIENMGTYYEVNVTIPKFKIETTIDLIESLRMIGIKSIFDQNSSQLTKITSEQLTVSQAKQKAFIEVNEEGAEAAAASGLDVVSYMATFYASFHADRPFAFYLMHADRIIFTGSINEFK